ncbi:hypothetical protein E2C01_063254 [Portunus trituberculatus]|uniref:Uncharacterized protein n=1 Tax=Portunus trituberculatus TaxID=210409 RepID=A0A5B7H8P8_PORTR|nr:hypothetical protein [Portunus trituberculatus]
MNKYVGHENRPRSIDEHTRVEEESVEACGDCPGLVWSGDKHTPILRCFVCGRRDMKIS